jgi:predicted transcriptional regulator
MIKQVLILAATLVLLSGCNEKSDTVSPLAKPKAFPAVSDPYDSPANHLKVKLYSDQIKLGFILTAEFLTEVLHFFKDRQ